MFKKFLVAILAVAITCTSNVLAVSAVSLADKDAITDGTEIKIAYEIADGYHTSFIMPKETDENPMLSLGLNYVRFGQEEKNLFRFLFQTDKFGGKDVGALMSDPGLSEILGIMAAGLEMDVEQARDVFLTFFCVAHGMASLLANNSMEYDEGQCRKMLEQVFYGMIAAQKGA